jgi:mono/diheme cytochrome c family protein/glucose/arabinose dehydrogenase
MLALTISSSSQAQQGDEPGETQAPLPSSLIIPPAPPLAPDQALKTFQLPPGFRIELVAAEPLVQAPVAMCFDVRGRIWALEMTGYMPNLEGKGEDQPVGRVVILEDTNRDGRFDSSKVFVDGLVMARALALVHGGALIGEPPKLWFCPDRNRDDKADGKIEVADDYGSPANPEHTANGLLWGLDNWIYSANHTVRFRYTTGAWERGPTVFRGQWGITQDDFGRLFYNSNSDQFRGDLVPAEYLERNPHYAGASGANVQLTGDQTTWPGRINPGINRGYQPDMLRDGKLAKFTAACGPLIYRGDNFPSAYRGNAFVCEPSGNFIRRNILVEHDGVITATNGHPRAEFLISTDERFRPVNLYNGPDGALYIVDMYRGILQHRIYMTTFLRNQVLDRGLDRPINLGRIYRVVHGKARRPNLRREPRAADLVKRLSDPNGWWRDMAQRLLVEMNTNAPLQAIRNLTGRRANPLARIHALWTLHGLGQLDESLVTPLMTDPHPRVRISAMRAGEIFLERSPVLQDQLLALASDPMQEVRWQAALSLGQITGAKAQRALAELLTAHASNAWLRDAVLSGLGGRELEFLEHLLAQPAWSSKQPGFDSSLNALAGCVFKEGKPERVARLLELVSTQPAGLEWRQLALLDGAISTAPPNVNGNPVTLTKEPALFSTSFSTASPELRTRLDKVAKRVTWPGHAAEAVAAARPLTPEEETNFQKGKEAYSLICGACHQPHGNGQEGLAPPLAGSEWVLGPDERLVRIALHGMRGPVTVKGKVYELEMPAASVLEDEQIAQILTYIRREWGHTGNPIGTGTVARIRAETASREQAWTEEELLKIP